MSLRTSYRNIKRKNKKQMLKKKKIKIIRNLNKSYLKRNMRKMIQIPEKMKDADQCVLSGIYH